MWEHSSTVVVDQRRGPRKHTYTATKEYYYITGTIKYLNYYCTSNIRSCLGHQVRVCERHFDYDDDDDDGLFFSEMMIDE